MRVKRQIKQNKKPVNTGLTNMYYPCQGHHLVNLPRFYGVLMCLKIVPNILGKLCFF